MNMCTYALDRVAALKVTGGARAGGNASGGRGRSDRDSLGRGGGGGGRPTSFGDESRGGGRKNGECEERNGGEVREHLGLDEVVVGVLYAAAAVAALTPAMPAIYTSQNKPFYKKRVRTDVVALPQGRGSDFLQRRAVIGWSSQAVTTLRVRFMPTKPPSGVRFRPQHMSGTTRGACRKASRALDVPTRASLIARLKLNDLLAHPLLFKIRHRTQSTTLHILCDDAVCAVIVGSWCSCGEQRPIQILGCMAVRRKRHLVAGICSECFQSWPRAHDRHFAATHIRYIASGTPIELEFSGLVPA